MELTPREKDKLLIFTAALVAERRKARGLKLNYPEAVAYISAAILEGARDGRTVAELMTAGTQAADAPTRSWTAIAELITEVQVEATFPDGTKLVTVHQPIPVLARRRASARCGSRPGVLTLNEGRATVRLEVSNTGDRPIQVGSHYHFYETNPALRFDREAARGFRLDIAAGTAVRFEPGQTRTVELVRLRRRPRRAGLPRRGHGTARRRRRRARGRVVKTIDRRAYAEMYGPTTGDRVRLGDTDLVIEVERDLTIYGDEVKFGGGKVIRDGMGQSQRAGADVRRHRDHQRADRRRWRHRQGRHRHQGRAHRRHRQGRQPRRAARRRPSSSAPAPRSSPAKAASSPRAASTRTSTSSARSRARRR